jgi:hypothetical protein
VRDCIPQLAQLLADDGPPSDEVIAWLREGLHRWLFVDDGLPLPRVLGLQGTPRNARIALRDDALRAAASRLSGTPWQRACALHSEARTFERGTWRRVRHAPVAPEGLDAVQRDLWRACSAWPLPARVQSFLEIIER